MLHLLIHFAYESLWRHGGPPRPHGSQTSRSQHREHLAPVSSLGASKSPDLGPLGPAWRQKQNWKSSESEIPEVFRKERLNLISKLSNWLATRQHSAAVEFPAISGPESLQNTQVWVWVNSVDGTSGIFSLTQWISWRSNWKPIFFQYPKMWTALNLCLNMDLTLTNIPSHWNSYLTQLNVSSQG